MRVSAKLPSRKPRFCTCKGCGATHVFYCRMCYSYLRGGVRVGVLIRWLIRLVLFRALLLLWRIIRRR